MLENIPTYVIAGPLGAGKTSIARHWLSQRPEGERWAVLINEFGDIGLDAALLETGEEGLSIAEVAGGCVCCVNGAPFTVALGRLLRQARPHRLLVELSGLSHPQPLLQQLRAAPWGNVLRLQPLMVVLDGVLLRDGGMIPTAVSAAMSDSCTVIVNKAEGLNAEDRTQIEALLRRPVTWTSQGRLDIPALTENGDGATPAELSLFKVRPGPPASASHWSKGWLVPAEQLVCLDKVETFLRAWPWKRAKAILHTLQGWKSANLAAGDPPAWRATEWRRDSRLELIFDQPHNEAQLDEAWADCLITP